MARRLSEKPIALSRRRPVGVVGQAVLPDHRLFVDDLLDVPQEPRIVVGDRVDLLDREALAEGLADDEDAVGRLLGERRGHLVAAHAFEREHAVEAVEPGLEPAQRLLQAFLEVAADRHDLADRLHRGRQLGLGALELLEREARDLGDDVIDRRLEAAGVAPVISLVISSSV